ncbi:hypothetical protein GCM10009551_026490 [Nocardiopsis tropica]
MWQPARPRQEYRRAGREPRAADPVVTGVSRPVREPVTAMSFPHFSADGRPGAPPHRPTAAPRRGAPPCGLPEGAARALEPPWNAPGGGRCGGPARAGDFAAARVWVRMGA